MICITYRGERIMNHDEASAEITKAVFNTFPDSIIKKYDITRQEIAKEVNVELFGRKILTPEEQIVAFQNVKKRIISSKGINYEN